MFLKDLREKAIGKFCATCEHEFKNLNCPYKQLIDFKKTRPCKYKIKKEVVR